MKSYQPPGPSHLPVTGGQVMFWKVMGLAHSGLRAAGQPRRSHSVVLERRERAGMLVTNHVLSGALIGAVVRRPGSAFVLGVASHFVLDGMPHWGKWADDRQFIRVAVPDGLTGLATMAAFTAAAPRGRRAAVAAGMIGAALPDLDKPARMWFGRSPWPRPVNRFHSWIQDEAPGRFGHEAASAAFFAASAALLLRPRRPRRSGGRGRSGSASPIPGPASRASERTG
jgi:hypothetical protein